MNHFYQIKFLITRTFYCLTSTGSTFLHIKEKDRVLWYNIIQECIPVGCVPAACRPYAGVCFRWGSVPRGGLLLGGGGSAPGVVPGLGGGLLWGGAWSGWGVIVPGLGGGAWSGGVVVPGLGGLVSQHALRQNPPLWTEWQTGVKILPWPQLRCGR